MSLRNASAGYRYDAELQKLRNLCRKLGWHIDILRAPQLDWLVFTCSRRNLPPQGWKLHVSSSVIDSLALLQSVVPIVLRSRVCFKLPSSINGILQLNSGSAGSTQIGKILTVYTVEPAATEDLASRIHEIFPTTRGPSPPSDLVPWPGSAVSTRYGAIQQNAYVEDSSGWIRTALYRPDGQLEADIRAPGLWHPKWVAPIFGKRRRQTRTDSYDNFKIADRRYLGLTLIQRLPKGSTLLAVDAKSMKPVVAKFATPGVLEDINGVDAVSRLENEFFVLSYLRTLQLAPRPLGFDRSMGALVMSDLGGESLALQNRQQKLRSLAGLAPVVERLHSAGVVHRDLKPTNVISTGRTIKLIDFEFAQIRGAERSMVGGTPGYVAPDIGEWNISDDYYSLGMMLAEALIEYDPALLPRPRTTALKLLDVLGYHRAARTVKHLTAPKNRRLCDPRKFAAAALRLRGFRPKPFRRSNTDCRLRHWASKAAVRAASAAVRFQSKTGAFSNRHIFWEHECKAVNIGAAGILLALLTIRSSSKTRRFDAHVLRGAHWLARREPSVTSHGLFSGNAGVALALAVAGRLFGQKRFLRAAADHLSASAAVTSLDLFSGAAGVIMTYWLLREVAPGLGSVNDVLSLSKRVVDSAIEWRGMTCWPASKSLDGNGFAQTGVAHGAGGIALSLLVSGHLTANQEYSQIGRSVLSALAGDATSSGVRRYLTDESNVLAPHGDWCHGPCGLLWAVNVGEQLGILLRRERAAFGRLVSKAAIVGNPTLCHGMASRLEVWRTGGVRKSASGSVLTVQALRALELRERGTSRWVSEDPNVITPDFWVGFLGPAVELALWSRARKAPLWSPMWLRELFP